jgi:hypothetical protein
MRKGIMTCVVLLQVAICADTTISMSIYAGTISILVLILIWSRTNANALCAICGANYYV